MKTGSVTEHTLSRAAPRLARHRDVSLHRAAEGPLARAMARARAAIDAEPIRKAA